MAAENVARLRTEFIPACNFTAPLTAVRAFTSDIAFQTCVIAELSVFLYEAVMERLCDSLTACYCLIRLRVSK